ncbi:squalene synthase HpnC [Lentzea sp. E54]|uniref:squalene synthase HpnC n=1 Tax=Lentzea xerophila TaxID=3435883 RepID=UPI003DA4FB5D
MNTVLDMSPAALRLRAGRENFPVALKGLPRRLRRDLLALYGVARWIDELGDAAPGDRLTHLDAASDQIRSMCRGVTTVACLREAVPVVRAHAIPAEVFLRLLEANRRDQLVRRYETYAQLQRYCALSANPVGELVLRLFGKAGPGLLGMSDAICTALQLVEHLQDVGEDHAAGRVYLPREDMRRFGCPDVDLAATRTSPALRRLVHFETLRAEVLFDRGAPLVRVLDGWARIAVAGFLAGGRATTAALRASNFDVLGRQVRPARHRVAAEFVRALV